MKVILLINEFTNSFNKSFKQNLNPLNLESKIRDVGDNFTLKGLNNKLKLLTYRANKINLTIEDYYNLKYGKDYNKELNNNIEKLINIKYDQKLTSSHSLEYIINAKIPLFNNQKDNNIIKELLSYRAIKYI